MEITEFLKNVDSLANMPVNNKGKYYKYVIEYLLSKNRPINVVETGSMYTDDQGSFTKILAQLISEFTGGKLITIDINLDHINSCKELTKDYANSIEYINEDSVQYLKRQSDDWVNSIDLFYFDSFDIVLPDPKPSQIHHLRELIAVYHRLRDDVILSIDDNYLPSTEVQWRWNNDDRPDEMVYSGSEILGKGTLINDVLLEEGWLLHTDLLVFPRNNTLVYTKR